MAVECYCADSAPDALIGGPTLHVGARVNLSTALVDPARIGIPLTPVVGLESESESERTDHCAALTRRLFVAGNKVRRFKTFVAMSRVKVGMQVPVDWLRGQEVAP